MEKRKQHLITLCLLSLASRILFKIISGYDNYELFYDSLRYDDLSNRILEGNLSLDVTAYLIAPLYPYTLALFKYISISHWEFLTVAYQFGLIALSTVYIYKITEHLFKSSRAALLAGIIYIFYPLTLWFNFTLTQESSFQAFFIFFIYYYLKTLSSLNIKDLILSSVFFAAALLTKSHILIAFPFLIFLLFIRYAWPQALIFTTVILIFTMPHSLINKQLHDVFTLSSHGNGSFFLLGHSNNTYDCLLNQAGNMGAFSADGCDPGFVFDLDYNHPGFGFINQKTVKERNRLKWQIAFEWIKNNPRKYLELKMYGLQRFIIPGLDMKQYKSAYAIISILLGLIIYVPAIMVFFKEFRKDSIMHALILVLYLTIAVIFIGFFPVNRFRVITLEPFLICYASMGFIPVWNKIKMLLQSN